MRTQMAIVAVALIPAVVAAQEPEQTEPAPRALATVDGERIDEDDLWWYMEQTEGARLLDELILRRLIAAEAREQGVKVGEPEVDEALERVKAEHGSEEQFRRWLHESGRTLKGLRMTLQQELLIDKLLRERMGLTEEGVRRYYDSHPEEFMEPPRVHLYDIVALTLDEAFEARERLAAGEAFEEVAADMSHDPTAEEGGDRGWITREDVLRDNVKRRVFSMAEGEVSDPVDCEDHYHVFYAREVEPGHVIGFEEARPRVVERIREVRGISEELLLAVLMRRAEIEVTWDAHEYLNDVYAEMRAIKIVVDDRRIDLPAPAKLRDGQLIVPAQALLEAMGAEVTWDEQAGELTATRGDVQLFVAVAGGRNDEPFLTVNDSRFELTVPPEVTDEVVLLRPLPLVKAMGATHVWNRAENTLYVSTHSEENPEEGVETEPGG